MFSFDEELKRLQRSVDRMAPVYHIGRGGKGNLVGCETEARGGGVGSAAVDGASMGSDESSMSSSSRTGSQCVNGAGRLKEKLEKARNGVFGRK